MDDKLVLAHKSDILFYDLVQGDHRSVQVLKVKPRNYVSNADEDCIPENTITSHCLTPDQKTLVTFEELRDHDTLRKDVRIQALKIWSRDNVSDDVSDFQMI